MSNLYGPRIVTDGLVLNLDAGNRKSYPGSGSTWYDLSGNGRNFNWYTAPSFTTGSIPYFSTAGNRCTGPASNSFGINNTSGYTIFIACREISLTTSGAFKFYGDVGYSRGIFSHLTWGNIVYFDQAGCCGSNQRTSAASGGSQTWNIWTLRRFTNSSVRTISKNGITLATNSNGASNIDLNSTGVDVGSSNEYGGNSSTWNARLQCFTVYNRGLSDAEIVNNCNAIKGRYGL
jgi:hypothetical protein